jgi:hypothetical protein
MLFGRSPRPQKTEEEAPSFLLLFLGPSLKSQAITHEKGSVCWNEFLEEA